MAGKKLLIAVSLFLLTLPAVCLPAADVKAQSSNKYRMVLSADRGPCLHNFGSAAPLLDDSRNDPNNEVECPGKSDFFR